MQTGLAEIRAAFGEPVDYLPAPTAMLIPDLLVIWSDEAGDPFQGPGNTTRHITAEIEMASVPSRPTAQTRLTHNGVVWKVKQVVDRDDVGAWVVTLEKA